MNLESFGIRSNALSDNLVKQEVLIRNDLFEICKYYDCLKKKHLLLKCFTNDYNEYIRYEYLGCYLNENFVKSHRCIGKGSTSKVYIGYVISGNLTFDLKLIALKKICDADSKEVGHERIAFKYKQFLDSNTLVLPIDIIEDNKGHIYIAFEKMDFDFRRYLNEIGNLPIDKSTVVSFCLISAIKNLHDNQIFHRDIKPENILFNQDSETGQIKLCDFGLARLVSKYQLTPQMVTIWYRAPEIINEEVYDRKVDIFSFGLVLLELINGRPFLLSESDIDHKFLIEEKLGTDETDEEDISKIEKEKKPGIVFEKFKTPKTFNHRALNIYFYLLKNNKTDDEEIIWKYALFIAWTLNINPKNRPNAEQVYNHEIFDKFKQ